MIKQSRPTRSEASDVSNAIMDGADTVMLSNESANGDYPVQSVASLSKICAEIEKTVNYKEIFNSMKLYTPKPIVPAEVVATSVC